MGKRGRVWEDGQSVELTELRADPRNARRHDERNLQAIESSLRQFGAGRSVVVRDGQVIAGNGTVAAAIASGVIKSARVVRASRDELIITVRDDLTEDEAVGLALADNRTGELAEWDAVELADAVANLQATEIDLGSLGLGELDLQDLLADLDGQDFPADDGGDGGTEESQDATSKTCPHCGGEL